MSSTPWSGRRLHFIGVGRRRDERAGARREGARRGRDRIGPGRVELPRALREAGIEPTIGHDARRTCPRAPRSWCRRRSPTTTRSSRPPASGALPMLHRGDLLGEVTRLRRTIAVAGHAREDDDREHGRARARRDRPRSELPDRRRGPLDRHERGMGDGGVARRRGGRVRPLVPQALAGGRGGHERRARPPRHIRHPRRAPGGVRPLHRGRSPRDRGGRGAGDRAPAAGRALQCARRRVRARGPGTAQRR